jgi:hypothetical protein
VQLQESLENAGLVHYEIGRKALFLLLQLDCSSVM